MGTRRRRAQGTRGTRRGGGPTKNVDENAGEDVDETVESEDDNDEVFSDLEPETNTSNTPVTNAETESVQNAPEAEEPTGVVETSKLVNETRDKLNTADDKTSLKPKLNELTETLNKKIQALLESITSKEGKYEAKAVSDANNLLEQKLADLEIDHAAAKEGATNEERKKEVQADYVKKRESAYEELTRSLSKVKADLYAIAANQASKIEQCVQKNDEVRIVLDGLKLAHEETLTQLRNKHAELLRAEAMEEVAIPEPTKEHVRQLFSYVVLHAASKDPTEPLKPKAPKVLPKSPKTPKALPKSPKAPKALPKSPKTP